jgi:hypothetical protein
MNCWSLNSIWKLNLNNSDWKIKRGTVAMGWAQSSCQAPGKLNKGFSPLAMPTISRPVERKEEDDSAGYLVARRHWLEARARRRCWMKRAWGAGGPLGQLGRRWEGATMAGDGGPNDGGSGCKSSESDGVREWNGVGFLLLCPCLW